MSILHKLARFVLRKSMAYHPDLTADVLRAHPDLGVETVRKAWEQIDLQAANGPDRMTSRYPILNQMGSGARQSLTLNLPKPTPFNIRRFSEYPPARRAINAISNPIMEMDWVVEPIPSSDASVYDENIPTSDQHQRIIILSNMFNNPNEDDSWATLLEPVLEDIIVGGFGSIEVGMTDDINRPVYLWPVDGQSIRINTEWPESVEDYRYSQSLGYVGMTVGTMETVHLRDDELIYMRLNPRTSTPFGYGYLETAFTTINAFIGAFEYAERRASNMTPNFGLFLGENVGPDVVRQWQMYWENEIEGYGKTPIIGGGRQPSTFQLSGTGEDQLWLKWQEFLIRVIAMSFGLSPMRLGLERDINRSTAETMSAGDWQTISPVALTFSNYINHKLIHQILGWNDLRFRWIVRDTDEKRQVEIHEIEYQNDMITVNELRRIRQRPPLPNGDVTKTEYEYRIQAGQLALDELEEFGGPPGVEQGEEARAAPPVVAAVDDMVTVSNPSRELEAINAVLTALEQEQCNTYSLPPLRRVAG